ncbi:hypothetical protein Esi_0024_0119 [Ectocarpus siliculosus]|uniref:EF-hand domain-containing protein n=1 Tax=Ectocarpus siliculosus TaxID=2880 RepID=D8LJ81_ECTSI|nr:hypothetical protein Esi_0024_0119 [Ectocarpus siliculosus]|eukprot:CBN76965.1 hypothetical protein Esi_0024_0119 [Ectocarpus siliculosus]
MVSAFDVELPFPVRDGRRRRLSINEVATYRDIALTRGHAGKALGKAKRALKMGTVEAARLVDIMRQVDVSAAGSLGRFDFSLALDRAGVELPAEDKDALFRSLSSARTAGTGCDIEMFAYLVNFWAGRSEGEATTPVAMAAGRREREQASHHIFPDNRQRRPASPAPAVGDRREEEAFPDMRRGGSLHGGGDQSAAAAAAGFRDHAAGEGDSGSPPVPSGHRSCWADNFGVDNAAAGIRASESPTLRGVGGVGAGNNAAATAAGKRNSFSVNMGDIMSHVAVKDGRSYRGGGGGGGPSGSIGGEDPGLEFSHDSSRQKHEGLVAADRLPPPPPASARGSGGSEMAGVDGGCGVEDRLPDQAYLHSLGYGNLGSVLPILLDRRSALETCLDRLDQGGSGRVRPGDFMAAVRQVGIALSAVQESNMMDLLHRMGAVTTPQPNQDGCQWVEAAAAVAAISLAGERAGGRRFLDKPRSPVKDGARLLDALSERYADVHVSLLPSSILLGPGALEERRAAPDDGAGGVFVTAGSLRNALRKAGVLLGDADERMLWRLLLRRGQETLGRSCGVMADGSDPDRTEHEEEEANGAAAGLLAQGMIPLPLLDAVMGFDAEQALHARRQLQRLAEHPPSSVPAAYRDHLGPWASAATGTPGEQGQRGGQDSDDAPLLLQKARIRVKALGDTMAEREKAVVRCLPKLGPNGERQRLPRVDLTRLLQKLRVGVRSGELQNLWYHMDRNKVTRQGFRRILLESTDSLPVTFPASPCPYPAAWPIGGAPSSSDAPSYASGDKTPEGGVSVSGAKLQRVLNRAAYEANVRHGVAGSAMTRALREVEGDERGRDDDSAAAGSASSSPALAADKGSAGGGGGADVDAEDEDDGGMPVLLQRAVRRVKELDNGEEVVAALVPDMGRVREGMRITRGGIQRVLHGLGVIPHSGELQQLWWCLERGGVGDPRISVEAFRDLLQGRTSKLVLLHDWNALGDGLAEDSFCDSNRQRALGGSGNVGGVGCDNSSPVSKALREVRTSLGLVRRRVRGIVRGCEDRDLSATGFVTEDAFMAVLKEQGILQQLGDFGLSSLRGAVLIGDGSPNTLADGTARVRYTGLVGAIDTYLEAATAWDKSEAAARLGVSESGTDRNGVRVAGEDAEAGSHADDEGGRRTPGDRNLASPGDRSFASPMQPPFRPGKKPIVVGAGSANTVARAARGWDNDAPVVPPGVRQYPRKKCAMAALVGNGGFGDGQRGGVREREHRNHYSPSSAMKDAFGLRGATPSGGGAGAGSEESALATPSPRHPGSASRNKNSGNPSEEEEEEEGRSGAIYDIYDGSAGRPRNGGSSRVDFRPAGGNPGLERADWSGGRRGSACKIKGMSGVGVSRSIRRRAAKALLSDRALLAGVFRQLSGAASGHQARDGLDRARLVKLFRYARMPLDLSQQEAEELADAVLRYCGAPTARFASLTTFLAQTAISDGGGGDGGSSFDAHANNHHKHGLPISEGRKEVGTDEEEEVLSPIVRRTRDDPIAQSIRSNVMQGRSELRLAGGDADSRLSCAVHLRRAFRTRRRNLGGDPGGVDDCSVAASDLNGVLQDMGVILNPTQAAFLIQKCRSPTTPGRRPPAGGMDEAPVRAGDVLAFFRDLLSDDC